MAAVVIFGANGRIGSRLVSEAATRGHVVTAVTRDGNRGDLPATVSVAEGDASCSTGTVVLFERVARLAQLNGIRSDR